MDGRDKRAIAMMAFGFFFQFAFQDIGPGWWRFAFLGIAWLCFLIGFVNLISERSDREGGSG